MNCEVLNDQRAVRLKHRSLRHTDTGYCPTVIHRNHWAVVDSSQSEAETVERHEADDIGNGANKSQRNSKSKAAI